MSEFALTATEPQALAEQVLGELEARACPANVAGMARYGIVAERNLGVTMPIVRALAKEAHRTLGKDQAACHQLALSLWGLGYRDARLVAAFVDDPRQVKGAQMEAWVADLDSWDICDGVCLHLFSRTPIAWEKAAEWTSRDPEFVKRAGFVLVASLAVHDKVAPDERFEAFLPVIECEATDPRNFVKKAVNWALRHIGKRNRALNEAAISSAERILASAEQTAPPTDASRAARWVARDALRELRSEAVQRRLAR